MGRLGECTWEQTYTGSCAVGESSLVNEVEFVVRDLFASPFVSVRDICAVHVFAVDVFDGEASEKYFVHVVVRGTPKRSSRLEEALDVSSSLHVRSYSHVYLNGVDGAVRQAVVRLGRLFSSPVEGTGVSQVYFTRVESDEVKRHVQRCLPMVSGFRAGSYVCSGRVSVSRSPVSQRRLRDCRRRRGSVFDEEEDSIGFSNDGGYFELPMDGLIGGEWMGSQRRRVSSFAQGLKKYGYRECGKLYLLVLIVVMIFGLNIYCRARK